MNYERESILGSVKKNIGLDPAYDAFDPDIVMHINTVFSILTQIGVRRAFSIADDSSTWSDYLSDDPENLEMVKTYMYAKVRMIFDPPTVGSVKESLANIISELEVRLNVEGETPMSGLTDY